MRWIEFRLSNFEFVWDLGFDLGIVVEDDWALAVLLEQHDGGSDLGVGRDLTAPLAPGAAGPPEALRRTEPTRTESA